MDLRNIYRIYNLMSHQHFMMSYSGFISQQSVRSLLSIAEKKLNQEESDTLIRKKVFGVMMECLQSVCKGESGRSDSVFLLGKDEAHYTLYSCFHCSESYKNKLVRLLEQLEQWDLERLKEEHRLLLADVIDHPNSSSLFSLIDITLRSKNRLSYDFVPDGDQLLFTLRTTIRHSLTA